MEFLEELLGMNLDAPMRTAIAFAAVLVLILLVAWIFRRLTRGGLVGTKRGRVARLAILEAIQIDQKRRLILLRRDNTEHLVMIGGGVDLVVEEGIHRAAQAAGMRPAERKEPAMRPASRAAREAQPAPRPAAAAAAPKAPEPKVEPRPEPSAARTEPKLEPAPAPRPEPRTEARPQPAPQPPAAARPTAASRPEPAPAPQNTQQTQQTQTKSEAGDAGPAEAQLSKMADRLKAALKDPAEPTATRPGTGNGRQTEQVREPDTQGR